MWYCVVYNPQTCKDLQKLILRKSACGLKGLCGGKFTCIMALPYKHITNTACLVACTQSQPRERLLSLVNPGQVTVLLLLAWQ